VTTYLNVPFAQRNEAKGARWDSEARKWFVPIGRDLEPFSSWLPVDPAKLASQDSVGAANGVPLSQLLAGVATAVERALASRCGRLPRSCASTATRTSI
jgi:exodeoxyribonuclease VII large subunit